MRPRPFELRLNPRRLPPFLLGSEALLQPGVGPIIRWILPPICTIDEPGAAEQTSLTRSSTQRVP